MQTWCFSIMHRSNMLFDVREPSNPHMADATMSHEISFNCGVTQQAFPVVLLITEEQTINKRQILMRAHGRICNRCRGRTRQRSIGGLSISVFWRMFAEAFSPKLFAGTTLNVMPKILPPIKGPETKLAARQTTACMQSGYELGGCTSRSGRQKIVRRLAVQSHSMLRREHGITFRTRNLWERRLRVFVSLPGLIIDQVLKGTLKLLQVIKNAGLGGDVW